MSNSLEDEAMCFGLSSWQMLLILSEPSCSVSSFLPVAFAAHIHMLSGTVYLVWDLFTHETFFPAGSAYCSTARLA